MARILKEEKHANGSLKYRDTLLDDQVGKQVILMEAWYPSEADPKDPWQAKDSAQQRGGQQWYKDNFINGQLHGIQESWHDNGQQQNKGNFVNGQRHGLHEGWYDDGQREYKENYVNGQRHGIQEGWYPSGADPEDSSARERGGQLEHKWNYVNGQLHGIQESWCYDNQQEYKEYHLDGVEVSQETYQAYIQGLASQIQEALDLEEPNLSKIIAGYLLP
jgi:antitoxin component YwqK of YwqJK toxin-antitoxin module